eukprot:1157129-Pelagomonas_calceolata.AAC.8
MEHSKRQSFTVCQVLSGGKITCLKTNAKAKSERKIESAPLHRSFACKVVLKRWRLFICVGNVACVLDS